MKFNVFAIATIAFLMFALPAIAHHSFAMFDREKSVTLTGVVKEFEWTNPHVWIHMMVPDQAGKPVAFICHAGWVPISAKILKGKRATSVRAIKDDMENAGVVWEDSAVVVDGNLISSRTPADLPQFCKALIAALRQGPQD